MKDPKGRRGCRGRWGPWWDAHPAPGPGPEMGWDPALSGHSGMMTPSAPPLPLISSSQPHKERNSYTHFADETHDGAV